METLSKKEHRTLRHRRVRSHLSGTAKRPRLSVFRSNRGIYAQLVDDEKGATIVSVHSSVVNGKTQREKAKEVGKEIAKRAHDQKITDVVFDRGGFLYAGKVELVAEGAREGGLKF